MAQKFFLSEAASEIAATRVLGEAPGFPFQLDLVIPIQAMAETDRWLSSPLLPAKDEWAAGAWTVELEVAAAPSGLSYTVETWRADKDGIDLAQIGSRPAAQTGVGTKSFSLTGSLLSVSKTDRVKLKLLATNSAGQSETLSVKLALSSLATPIADLARAARLGGERRGKFLGRLPRAGERRLDVDGFIEC